MIKIDSKSGILEVNGTRADLVTELTAIIRSLKRKGFIDDKDIEFVVETANKSDDELEKETLDRQKKIEDLMKMLNEIVFGKSTDIEELKKAMEKEWEK